MLRSLIILLFILPASLQAQQLRNEIRRGNSEYKDGNFSEAELHYRKALKKNPESPQAKDGLFNLGFLQEGHG